MMGTHLQNRGIPALMAGNLPRVLPTPTDTRLLGDVVDASLCHAKDPCSSSRVTSHDSSTLN